MPVSRTGALGIEIGRDIVRLAGRLPHQRDHESPGRLIGRSSASTQPPPALATWAYKLQHDFFGLAHRS
jgi:hypothetical protein